MRNENEERNKKHETCENVELSDTLKRQISGEDIISHAVEEERVRKDCNELAKEQEGRKASRKEE